MELTWEEGSVIHNLEFIETVRAEETKRKDKWLGQETSGTHETGDKKVSVSTKCFALALSSSYLNGT